MKLDLVDFVSLEEREQLIEKLLTSKDSTVVVNAQNLKNSPGKDDFNQLILTAKFLAERLRRHGREMPTIKLIPPDDPFALDLNRVEEMRRVAGVKIELL